MKTIDAVIQTAERCGWRVTRYDSYVTFVRGSTELRALTSVKGAVTAVHWPREGFPPPHMVGPNKAHHLLKLLESEQP